VLFGVIEVWDACANSKITFHKDYDDDSDNLAYIVENDVILSSIERQLEVMDSNVVQVKYDTRAKSYNFAPTASLDSAQLQPWVEVMLEDGNVLRTKLLVSSDGFYSRRRSKAFITVSLCECVCMSVHTIKRKQLKLQSTNLRQV